ncbi:MAG: response regulator receiver modulated diguanylate cyclase [Nitrospirae bacterium]|nr:response regulator receiver modulated diguanylate cyclase [Nitrospirota bacterium]
MAKARILLVEDSEAQAGITNNALQRSGYEVILASDGISAIKAIVAASPDVVLLDLILPGMSGTEVCRWIKHNNDTKGIPVIMLTALSSVDDKASGIKAGADDYLPKPYNEIELNAKIYAALRTKALQDELRQKNKQLGELLAKMGALAITDPLTGLYNRRQFDAVLEAEWKKSQRYNYPVSCLLLDIDFFKAVNDTYGHKAGDLVLIEIANILKKSIRDVDTVARWGGEEFIAMFPHTDKTQSLIVAQRMLEKVSVHEFEQFPDKCLTASIGLSCSSPSVNTKEQLIEEADKALYEAKRNGRNRIEAH